VKKQRDGLKEASSSKVVEKKKDIEIRAKQKELKGST